MIVVCTGCSAKFKVADGKVGPKGAKIRCSKCSTVFLVNLPEPLGPEPLPPEPAAPAPAAAEPPWVVPPPLPKRPAPKDRSAAAAPPGSKATLDLDLEPAMARPRGEPPPQGDDPFAGFAAAAAATITSQPRPDDPFAPGPGEGDPFAAVQAPIPEDLARPPPATLEPSGADPFGLDPFGTAAPTSGRDDLALEERAPPPPRPESSAPIDDPFGAGGPPLEQGEMELGGGHPSDVPPLAADLPGVPFLAPSPAPVAAPPPGAGPLHVDPFASAAVDAEPLAVAPPPRAGARPPPAAAREPRAEQGRLRTVAVNAVSLAVLLVVALALVVFWRGGGRAPPDYRPATLLAVVTGRPVVEAPLAVTRVTSGHYERERGAPLFFVRGEVTYRGAAPAGAVTVAVELWRDGRLVAQGAARAGAVPTPEELYGVADAAALAKLLAEAEARAPAELRPGQVAPFLIPFADLPLDLAGASLQLTATEARR